MRFRLATTADLEVLLQLRADAARWLAARGSRQWQRPYPNLRSMVARIEESLVAGQTWCVELDAQVVATITLTEGAYAGLWTPAEVGEPARYAHRLIVARELEGQGVGAELLDWAGTQAALVGERWLRVDAWTENRALHSYYERQGFQLVRIVRGEYPSGALLQRRASVVATPRLIEVRAGAVAGDVEPIAPAES